MGRRHRRGEQPTIRRADGLRRTARRILRDPRCVQAVPAWPDHRRFEGQGRAARAPHGTPDPRTAHPARQGDQQRLHGAGAPRRHGQHVRGLSRPRQGSGESRSECILGRWSWPTPSDVSATGCVHEHYFDTVCVEVPGWALPRLLDAARSQYQSETALPQPVCASPSTRR